MSTPRAVLYAIVLASGIVVFINFMPRCRPGDRGIYVGSVVLVGGCPR